MSKEDRRQYIFAQLGSLPNAMQYVEVTKYIEDLEQQVKKQKEIINKVKLTVKGTAYCGSEDYYMEKISKINELLKEVSE